MAMEKGVLASFVLLLSTVLAEQRDLNATSDDINNTFSTQEEFQSVKIMDLPFAQSLRNPCSWDASYHRPSHISLMGTTTKFTEEFFKYLKYYARIYENIVKEILINHPIENCSNLHLGSLTETPTLEELKGMDSEEALNKIYLSLLVHSAYSFVVHYQVNSTDVGCSNNIQREKNLARQSYRLALKQKTLACHVLVGMTVLGFEKEDVTSLLNEKVSDLSLCSRRQLRECQIMNSARGFLQVLQNYSVEDFRKSSSRMRDLVSSTISTSSTILTSSITYSPTIPFSTTTSSSTVPISSTTSSIISSSTTPFSTTASSSTIPISSTASSTTYSSTIQTSSTVSSLISITPTTISSPTASRPPTMSISSIISALLTTSSSLESNTSNESATE